MSVEFWRLLPAGYGAGIAIEARRAEDEGWTGVGLPDTQNKLPDPYVAMTVAGLATSRLRLATSVTNPFTRNAAVTASAISTVQSETGGRALLGIGRGDSSLAHLGFAPAPVAVLSDYLRRVQAYLRGEPQPFLSAEGTQLRAVDVGDLAGAPTESALDWLDPTMPKVRVAVAATGPKVISAAAVVAEEVTLAVGASVERIRWGVERVRTARAEAGLDERDITIGAYIPIIVHDDFASARQLIAGDVASFARFSVMRGTVAGPASGHATDVLKRVHSVYDMGQHYTAGSAASQQIDDDLVDTFAIAGPAGHCVERLGELVDAGVSKFFVLRVGRGIDPAAHEQAERDFVTHVLSVVR
jgi:5,10-methylenetetrahydromethanopterin reductase